MIYRRFRFIYSVRILLLVATVCLFFIMISRTHLYALTIITGACIVLQAYSLLLYVEKTNRDLNRFLEAIKYEDFSQTYSITGLGSSFNELKAAFNEVLKKFQQTRAEKEEHYRYLQTIVEHVGIGLLSFRQDGEVELINKAAKKLLKVPRLKNIRSLEPFSPRLVDALFRLKPGEKALVKVEDMNDLQQFVMFATEIRLRDRQFMIVSIQNIQSELEEKEMEAWQNLIRVLTHEIMNSVTPISSLASTANGLLTSTSERGGGGGMVSAEMLQDISSAVQTIQKRSEGLLHFVDSYRKLTRIPRPNFQIFTVVSLFERVGQLMESQMKDRGIGFTHRVDPETLELTADPEMVEQILINLVLNAIDAVKKSRKAKIDLYGGLNEQGRVLLHVTDNGSGIMEEVQEKIFIPFFTTKKEGTGIGLSLSRQIMRLHRGTIAVRSKPNMETVFTLRF
ncbi:MAG: ATP-binding protein [bacterium]